MGPETAPLNRADRRSQAREKREGENGEKTMTFESKIADQLDTIRRATDEIKRCQVAAEFLRGVDLDDVSWSGVYTYEATDENGVPVTRLEIDFGLEYPQSRLCHVLARKFHVEFKKSQGWDGASLRAISEKIPYVFGDIRYLIHFEISGLVPATCHIETEEIPLTEEELAKARAEIKTVRTVRKIVCKE